MMNNPSRIQCIAFTLVSLLFMTGIFSGLHFGSDDDVPYAITSQAESGFLMDLLGRGGDGMEGYLDDVARTYEGGGSTLLFVDDMSRGTADYMDAYSWFPDEGVFHGGAAPEPLRRGVERWTNDLHRWGHGDASDKGLDDWHHDPSGTGAWRFGHDEDGVPAYNAGSLAELVSPIIDLTSLEVPGPEPDADVVVGYSQVFDDQGQSSTTGAGQEGYLLPDPCTATANSAACPVRDPVNDQYRSLTPGGTINADADSATAAAALRVRHAYEFEVTSEMADGSRLEISRFDAQRGQWVEWQGLLPSAQSLRVGTELIESRSAPLGTPLEVTVQPDDGGSPKADVYAADVIHVEQEGDEAPDPDSLFVSNPRDRADLYRGFIASSSEHTGTSWTGFGGTSDGFIESVFDLSQYAGSKIRVRFVTSTANPFEGTITTGFEGWTIDHVEVHANGAEGIQVIDVPNPGNGAILHASMGKVEPVVALHNTGRSPVTVLLNTTIHSPERDPVHFSKSFPLGVGPAARLLVPVGGEVDLDGLGLYRLQVEARSPLDPGSGGNEDYSTRVDEVLDPDDVVRYRTDAEENDASDAPDPGTGNDTQDTATREIGRIDAHFLTSEGGDWHIRRVDFRPLVEQGDGSFEEGFGKFVFRDQPGRIRIELENTAPVPKTLKLSGNDDPHGPSSDWDLRPALVDPTDQFDGQVVPTQSKVELPVSRDIAGAKGQADAIRVVEWDWDGSDIARPLRLLVRDGDGNVLFDGGLVIVQSVIPTPFHVEFRNQWQFNPTDLPKAEQVCQREPGWQGRPGVVRCSAGPAAVHSPGVTVTEVDLLRGNQTSLTMSHLDRHVRVILQAHETSVPQEVPPTDPSDWVDLHTLEIPDDGGGEWVTTQQPLASLPRDFSGHLRLWIESDNDTLALDRVALNLDLEGDDGATTTIALLSDDFDKIAAPPEPLVRATTEEGMVHLHGTDEWTKATDISVLGANPSPIQDGRLEQDTIMTSAFVKAQGGRWAEDSILMLPGPIDLTDVARPQIHFNHWYETIPAEFGGAVGTAYVEVLETEPTLLEKNTPIIGVAASDETLGLMTPAGTHWLDISTVPVGMAKDLVKGTVCSQDCEDPDAAYQIHGPEGSSVTLYASEGDRLEVAIRLMDGDGFDLWIDPGTTVQDVLETLEEEASRSPGAAEEPYCSEVRDAQACGADEKTIRMEEEASRSPGAVEETYCSEVRDAQACGADDWEGEDEKTIRLVQVNQSGQPSMGVAYNGSTNSLGVFSDNSTQWIDIPTDPPEDMVFRMVCYQDCGDPDVVLQVNETSLDTGRLINDEEVGTQKTGNHIAVAVHRSEPEGRPDRIRIIVNDTRTVLVGPDDVVRLTGPRALLSHNICSGLDGSCGADGWEGEDKEAIRLVQVNLTSPLGPLSALERADANDWTTVATYRGRLDEPLLAPEVLDIMDFAGKQVYLRFRYSMMPSVAAPVALQIGASSSPADPPLGEGWLIEDVAVHGWTSDGYREGIHQSKGFQGAVLRGGDMVGTEHSVGRVSHCWGVLPDGRPQMNCQEFATVGRFGNPYGIQTFMFDPMDLGGMRQPVMTLHHDVKVTTEGGSFPRIPQADLEYQFRNLDGTWPTNWNRATPNSGSPDYVPTPAGTGNPQPLTDPKTGQPNTPPIGVFYFPDEDKGSYQKTVRMYDGTVNQFDLTRLAAYTGEVRMRLHIWDSVRGSGVNHWNLTAIDISEYTHIVDAGIVSIEARKDGLAQVQRNAPQLIQEFSIGNNMVLRPNDYNDIIVKVENGGAAPVRTEVSLRVVNLDSGIVINDKVSWVEVVDQDGVHKEIKRGVPVARLGLSPDEVKDVLFSIDMLEAPPGRYGLTASIDVTDGIDTFPQNDIAGHRATILPIRDLDFKTGSSGVAPFATAAGSPRTIKAVIVNEGNLDEGKIMVSAQVVKKVGLFDFEPVPELAGVLQPQSKRIAAGGNAQEVTWRLDSSDFPAGVDPSDVLVPGNKYAVAVFAAPEEDSITYWWGNNKGLPLPEGNDGQQIVNVTQLPVEECSCMLVPFMVERILLETDFTAANSTSLLKRAYPVDTDEQVVDGWAATTYLEGAPLTDAARPDIPRWTLVSAEDAVEMFPGQPTGQVWSVEEYHGLEDVEHELVSPVLPTHVVSDQSRDVLSMLYASGAEEGQVMVENRRLVAGEWTPWVPVDELRSSRVAIVLSPDFPFFVPDGIGGFQNSYTAPHPNSGHPAPLSLYNLSGDIPYITDAGCEPDGNFSSTSDSGRCWWSPAPTYNATGPNVAAWMRALNRTLLDFTTAFGPDSVTLFTTLEADGVPNQGLGVGTMQGGVLQYQLPRGQGLDPYVFPIRGLDEMGLRLDSYGSIILMGDNAVETFASETNTYTRVSHGPLDAYADGPSDLKVKHHKDLFAILQAAQAAGVKTIATMGPAAATLARSGAGSGATAAVWQTDRAMPPDLTSAASIMTGRQSNVRSVADGSMNCLRVVPPPAQPVPSCNKPPTQTTPYLAQSADMGHPRNYYYVAPQDAYAFGIKDLMAAGGMQTASTSGAVTFINGFVYTNSCGTYSHPLLVPGRGSVVQCDAHQQTAASLTDSGLLVFSLGRLAPSSSPAAIDAVVSSFTGNIINFLQQVSGALPAGDGTWQELPPELSFPIGGTFWRDGQGIERFDGNPTQVRIRIQSDIDVGGHGPFALDRFGVLGTNRTTGVGIRIIDPGEGSSYVPGRAFTPLLEVTNRGVHETFSTSAELSVVQIIRNVPGECESPHIEGLSVTIPFLDAGEQKAVRVAPPNADAEFNGGVFPYDPECSVSLWQQDNAYEFHVEMDPVEYDDDPFDDADKTLVFGREVLPASNDMVLATRVLPNEAAIQDLDEIIIENDVHNTGTQSQTFTMTVSMQPARALACWRPNPDQIGNDMYGCDEHDRLVGPITLPSPKVDSLVHVGERETMRYRFDPADIDLRPGSYRLSVQVSTGDSGGNIIQSPVVDRWLHVAAHPEVDEAISRHPNNGGYAVRAEDFDGIVAIGTQSTPDQWFGPYGVSVSSDKGTGGHSGAWGPDTTTQDANGNPLNHGWRAVTQCEQCTDTTSHVLEWRREGAPTHVGRSSWDTTQNGHPDTIGRGDFGNDTLTWMPDDPADSSQNASSRQTYLTLSAHERPVLSVLTRFDATQNTGLTVWMQMPKRMPCSEGQTGTNCGSTPDWNWNTPWLNLNIPHPQASFQAGLTMDGFQSTRPGGLNPIPIWVRPELSNPQFNNVGFWGESSGVVEGDGGWQRIHIPLDAVTQPGMYGPGGPDSLTGRVGGYCGQAVAQSNVIGTSNGNPEDPSQLFNGLDPCKYAYATGDDSQGANGPTNQTAYISRPVRFHFQASSSGGDVGESYWQIADVSLTEHRITFTGADSLPLALEDNEERTIAVRVQNSGTVTDEVRVTHSPPPGLSTVRGLDVDISLFNSFDQASDAVEFGLDPGESKVVWVRIQTGILDGVSGRPAPFFILAESLRDPNADDRVLIDAAIKAKEWPDIRVDRLVLGDDDRRGTFHGPVRSPVKPVLIINNEGTRDIGGSDEPLAARLIEWRLDDETEQRIPGSQRIVETVTVKERLSPTKGEVFVDFDEWVPLEVGKYQLVADINLVGVDGRDPVPEQQTQNNIGIRDVFIGPVRFADLHIVDVWMVEFDGGCDGAPVDRAISGHSYCLVAEVENQGRQAAFLPHIDFRLGASAPFSSGVPPLEEAFEDSLFPGIKEDGVVPSVITKSTPRLLTLRGDGSNTWQFEVEVSSQNIFPNFDNKVRGFEVEVDLYKVVAKDVPDHVVAVPGKKTVMEFNVTNKGNVAVTPIGIAQTSQPGLRVHFEQVPTLRPEETVAVRAVLQASESLRDDAVAPTLLLTSAEDRFIQVPIQTELEVRQASEPITWPIPTAATPGPALVELVLDNSDYGVMSTWELVDIQGPAAVGDDVTFTTGPYERIVAEVPLVINDHTSPGRHALTALFDVHQQDARLVVEAPAQVDVLPKMAGNASIMDASPSVPKGSDAVMHVRFVNEGNIPVSVRVDHSAGTEGTVFPLNDTAMVLAGEERRFRFVVEGVGLDQTLGSTHASWTSGSGQEENTSLLWKVIYGDHSVQLVQTDLADMGDLPADTVHNVRATVLNPGDKSLEVEVLIAVNGILHGRVQTMLAGQEERVVTVPFRTGPVGEVNDIIVLTRPLGVQASINDPSFYQVGGAESHPVTSIEKQDTRATPTIPISVTLAVLAGLVLAIRRRSLP